MPVFKQGSARLAMTAGGLAAVAVAVIAIGSVNASSAFACVPPGQGTIIKASGSSLQRLAQEKWDGSLGCETSVTYSSVDSPDELAAFAFTSGLVDTTLGFIGTDNGPNPAQIANAESVSGTKPLAIPVAQTAIAVVINPPSANIGCKLRAGSTHGINYVQLTQIFGGKEISTWGQMREAGIVEGTECTGNIVRVVRKDASGATYQFKNYLAVLQASFSGKSMPCSLPGVEENASGEKIGEPSTTAWKNMRWIGALTAGGERPPNTTWPQPISSKAGFCSGTTELVQSEDGAGVAAYVATNNGTIGYAALPDAKAKDAEVAQLQNSTGVIRYASPLSGTASNCGARQYTVPKPGRPAGSGGVPPAESGVAVSWSQVFGALPTVGGGVYPLCMLTYDIAWQNYTTAGYGAKVAPNVKSYLEYVLGPGQSLLGGLFYQALPSPIEPEHNVVGAAKLAWENIS